MGSPATADRARVRVRVRGAVQGVGFRPFVFRLATDLGLAGWVSNTPEGVLLEAEGARERIGVLLQRLQGEAPPRAVVQALQVRRLDPLGEAAFAIRPSHGAGAREALILPDGATCPDCLREILDPADRRYRYPFANCTNCGPRFSIIQALPYDRGNTTMRGFVMCPACRAEYEDPRDRRFHAQPNACPRCGPHLALWRADGSVQALRDEALARAAAALRGGAIAAVKGLGGFHLMVDARDDEAVGRLRRRKRREAKPLALMVPSLEDVAAACEVSPVEQRLLDSPEAPIVLLRRRRGGADTIAPSVAPGNPYLGVMLPYTPLHHLLLREAGIPLVATSGNLSDEPMCTDEREALERLGGVADLFLVHDRPIARPVDDSVVRVMMGREVVLRRSRGYAPLPIPVRGPGPCVLAVGGHLKNTVAVRLAGQVFLGQHVGDLESAPALEAFQRAVRAFEDLYEAGPAALACDAHPDYASTRFAEAEGRPVIRVQHHFAHVAACMAEHGLAGPVLGVAWDGTGYGLDGTVWGGEFLRATAAGFERLAHLRRFRLPGGDRAVAEPRRAALGLLYECFGDKAFEMADLAPVAAFRPPELRVLRRMLERGVNAPLTSSAGRLFDAVAAIVGLHQRTSFEGQAAMALEFARDESEMDGAYPTALSARAMAAEDTGGRVHEPRGGGAGGDRLAHVVDWGPMLQGILEDLRRGRPAGAISARFHGALVEAMVAVARLAGEADVVLTGGCFQNRRLAEQAIARLRGQGFRVFWHRRVPPGDGGIALGQAVVAAAALAGG